MNVSLYQSAAALHANNRWQEMIGENLSSGSLTGYKKQDISFSAFAAGIVPQNGRVGDQHYILPKAETLLNFSNGELTHTGEKTDLALESSGFFEIQMPNGTHVYTRNGAFHIDASGQLVTKAGYIVMGDNGPIQLDPRNPFPLTISANGEVKQGEEIKGQIKVVDFNNPQLLTSVAGNYYVPTDPKLVAFTPTDIAMRQGFLEASNSSSVHEMANLIMAMRNYEANQKVIQTHDDRMSRAISELGTAS